MDRSSPYVIRISSLKGGVGKTTVATNLAVALQMRSYKTLLVDYDSINPSIRFHMGMTNSNKSLLSCLKGDSTLADIIEVHEPSGVEVVNGDFSDEPFIADERMLNILFDQIKKTKYDFIIIDTRPGYYIPYLWRGRVSEALLVTTPYKSSFTGLLNMAKQFDAEAIMHRMVLNRVTKERYELTIDELKEAYNGEIIGTLSEDKIVPESISAMIPAILFDKNAKFSKEMLEISKKYLSDSV